MLKVNKKTEYALIAIKFMTSSNKKGELTSAREICDLFHTPFDTTAKVMQAMSNHGLMLSVQGVKGGYKLVKPLSKIGFMDVHNAVEKESFINFCEHKKGVCSIYDTCNIISPMDQLNKKVELYLRGLSLEELFSIETEPTTEKIQQNRISL